MVLVQFLLKRDHESASNVPPLAPPMGRTYIQYPKQVVATNTTQWIPASFIYSEAFVFHVSEVENGAVATAVGMQNAYTVTHKCRLPEKQVTAIAKGFLTFPYMDCHSHRMFEFLSRIARHLQEELNKSSIAQVNSKSKHLDLLPTDFEYLVRCLGTIPLVERDGVSTIRVTRAVAARESIKQVCKKRVIRVDTKAKMHRLKSVFGVNLCIGVRKPPPATPKLPHPNGTLSHSVLQLHNIDWVNSLVLPEEPVYNQQYTAYTKDHGIDFLYDPVQKKLTLKMRFSRWKANDLKVQKELGTFPVEKTIWTIPMKTISRNAKDLNSNRHSTRLYVSWDSLMWLAL